VESQDFEFEKFKITESIRLAFHSFDFIIGTLQGYGGDWIVIVGQDAGAIQGQGFVGYLNEYTDPRGLSAGNPVLEESG
jgi:hypothetical protein